MDNLAEYVCHSAEALAELENLRDPEAALFQCSYATQRLGEEMGEEAGVASYEVEVRVTDVPEDSAWARSDETGEDIDYLWHYVLAVPEVGIVDTTGSQLGREPVRILQSLPEAWTETRAVNAMGPARDPVHVYAGLCSGDPLPAQVAFNHVMGTGQVPLQ